MINHVESVEHIVADGSEILKDPLVLQMYPQFLAIGDLFEVDRLVNILNSVARDRDFNNIDMQNPRSNIGDNIISMLFDAELSAKLYDREKTDLIAELRFLANLYAKLIFRLCYTGREEIILKKKGQRILKQSLRRVKHLETLELPTQRFVSVRPKNAKVYQLRSEQELAPEDIAKNRIRALKVEVVNLAVMIGDQIDSL